ncbi:unnamed protein product [Bursaphelenchus xylophilus]|uniref:(pine wood nematode) hypothetical protein n=1 Tax=Bursaphelenchus xylophilus TaxID=6326 RepID=A0A1I7RX33_BURXY|nr:unnamed protein product [Bursaphelenchus xylophilus]CAG9121293.1 unnamed protein product [Bursaphelenchus xylophilus]
MTRDDVPDVFEPKFDIVPLIIELSCLGGFAISLAIFEVIYRKGLIFKEDQEGPTKIHREHLQEYKKQEDKFLANGGQANPMRQREKPAEGSGEAAAGKSTVQGGAQTASAPTSQSKTGE